MAIQNQGWAYVSGSGAGAAGGSNTEIQFNDVGALGGSSDLTWDGSTVATTDISASINISASAFYGDGSNLTGITASAVNVADGPEQAIQFRVDTPVSGEISGSSYFMFMTASNTVQLDGASLSSSLNVSASAFYGELHGPFSAGTDDTVLVFDGTKVATDEIDSRVWGATLVDASGTPVDSQIGVWTDANTMEGDSKLTWDGSIFDVTGALAVSGTAKASNFIQKVDSTEHTVNFSITNANQVYLVNCTGSVITGTLPSLTTDSQVGETYTVKDLHGSGSTNDIAIEPAGSQKIDGGTAALIQTNYGAITLAAISSSVGYNWGIVSVT